MISYYRSIGPILYRFQDTVRYSLLVENREIDIPHLYSTPRRGWLRRNFVKNEDVYILGTRIMGP